MNNKQLRLIKIVEHPISHDRQRAVGVIADRALHNEDDYRAIHRQLFDTLYDWAGEYRTIDISKKGTAFAGKNDIPELLTNCLKRLKSMDYFRGLSFDDFIEELVDIYCTTNYIHPFREGNGRTQRVFISQLVRYNGYEISFSKIDTDYLMVATIHAAHGVVDYLREIFKEHIKIIE